MNHVRDGRLAEYPFGEAVEEHGAKGNEDADTEAAHDLWGTSPEEADRHLEPTQPEDTEQNKTGKT